MSVKFFVCEHCGNLIETVNFSGVPMVCCGSKMKEIIPGTVEASREKHIPVATVNGNCVDVVVGSIEHPMTEAHYIEWLVLETENGIKRINLTPDSDPKAVFALAEGEKAVAVYAYCNLHGLWKAEL